MANYNTNLEDVFNLEPVTNLVQEDDVTLDDNSKELSVNTNKENTSDLTQAEILDKVDKISAALPEVKGLESSDKELDELADYAIQSYKDIQDLGFNADMKNSAEILSVAGNMLAHAITAKTNKITKKLKMIELQIKKHAVDARYANSIDTEKGSTLNGNATVIDRNQLLRELLDAAKNKDS